VSIRSRRADRPRPPEPRRTMAGKRRPRVTIATIADQAGVSIPTVSKVLNGRGDVSPATRELVEARLRESGYQRRRSTKASPVPMIDLVFHDLGNPWAVELIRGVEEAARDQNFE